MFKKQTVLKKGAFLFIFPLFLVLTGCGSNLLKSLSETLKKVDPNEIIRTATTPQEYKEAQTLAQNIIDDKNASLTKKQEAHVAKGKAILGQNNVSMLDIFGSIAEVAQPRTSQQTVSKNIFVEITNKALKTDVSINIFIEAATAFNTASSANLIASPNLRLTTSVLTSFATENVAALDRNDQLLRGMANTLCVIRLVNNVYNLDQLVTGGNLQPRKTQNTEVDNLKDLLYEDTKLSGFTGAQKYRLGFHAFQAIDAFDAAGVFTNDQINEIKKIKDIANNVVILFDGYTAGSASVTVNSKTYDFSNSATKDNTLKTAMNDLFKSINK